MNNKGTVINPVKNKACSILNSLLLFSQFPPLMLWARSSSLFLKLQSWTFYTSQPSASIWFNKRQRARRYVYKATDNNTAITYSLKNSLHCFNEIHSGKKQQHNAGIWGKNTIYDWAKRLYWSTFNYIFWLYGTVVLEIQKYIKGSPLVKQKDTDTQKCVGLSFDA